MLTATKILLVDDDLVQLKLSRAYLEDAGYSVESACNAHEAVAMAHARHPDLIVSDVLMGEVDGFGLCRQLKSTDSLSQIPVMLLSSHYGGEANEQLAKHVGAIALIERTADFERELAEVKACLRRVQDPNTAPETTYEEHLRTNANQLTKLAEQHRRSEERIRMLLDNAHDTITVLTTDGIITESNQRWRSVLGIDPAELIGIHINELAAPGFEEANFTTFRESLEEGAANAIVPLRHRITDATVFLEFSRRVIVGSAGTEVIMIGRDVTDKLDAELRAAKAEASRQKLEASLAHRQKMEALGELTGGIAHDFNNMLAVILTYTHFLIENMNDDDPRREDVGEIKNAADRAASLTRQLLAFSRRQMLELAVLDVPTVVTSLTKMLGRLIGEDIDLSISNAAVVGSIRADVSQLEQVITNLVVNARDAMPTGGRLEISTSNYDAPADGEVPAGHYVKLAVSDTGCGMDDETKRRIFEPFFTTKDRGRGTGLGLSTSYGIVQQFGGHLVVDSTPGVGTVMTVLLPRIDQEATNTRQIPIIRQLRGTETVLLIEDDRAVRTALCRVLVDQGYEVLSAAGAHEAFARVDSHDKPIALIVSDVVMPGASGPEIVAELLARLPNARAILMSGYTEHAMIRDAADRSPSFLQKPFSPEALAQRVREVLDAEMPR